MTLEIDILWLRTRPILAAFAQRLKAIDPALFVSVGRAPNDAHVLRGCLTVGRQPASDEVAVRVDVWSDGQDATIESDIGTRAGEILAVGPCVTVGLSGQVEDDALIARWIRELEPFLRANESVVIEALSESSSQ
jgi:hypothetical protein